MNESDSASLEVKMATYLRTAMEDRRRLVFRVFLALVGFDIAAAHGSYLYSTLDRHAYATLVRYVAIALIVLVTLLFVAMVLAVERRNQPYRIGYTRLEARLSRKLGLGSQGWLGGGDYSESLARTVLSSWAGALTVVGSVALCIGTVCLVVALI